jgi:hypothetical protein
MTYLLAIRSVPAGRPWITGFSESVKALGKTTFGPKSRLVAGADPVGSYDFVEVDDARLRWPDLTTRASALPSNLIAGHVVGFVTWEWEPGRSIDARLGDALAWVRCARGWVSNIERLVDSVNLRKFSLAVDVGTPHGFDSGAALLDRTDPAYREYVLTALIDAASTRGLRFEPAWDDTQANPVRGTFVGGTPAETPIELWTFRQPDELATMVEQMVAL